MRLSNFLTTSGNVRIAADQAIYWENFVDQVILIIKDLAVLDVKTFGQLL